MASQKWVGQSLKRTEDPALLTGCGSFVGDLPFSNLCHAAILRSPHAHARIRNVDTAQALRAPGVLGIVTGADAARLTGPFPVGVEAPIKYYCMAIDKVRYVGEPVAVVVARDRYLAEDAMDLIEVEYEPLEAVVDPELALKSGAPLLHEAVGSNLACRRTLRYGDPERAFLEADVLIRARFRFPKYSSTPIETYGGCVLRTDHRGAQRMVEFHGPVRNALAGGASAKPCREPVAVRSRA
jgi:2-furoyl-CoA dehydrogenase large subunit